MGGSSEGGSDWSQQTWWWMRCVCVCVCTYMHALVVCVCFVSCPPFCLVDQSTALPSACFAPSNVCYGQFCLTLSSLSSIQTIFVTRHSLFIACVVCHLTCGVCVQWWYRLLFVHALCLCVQLSVILEILHKNCVDPQITSQLVTQVAPPHTHAISAWHTGNRA